MGNTERRKKLVKGQTAGKSAQLRWALISALAIVLPASIAVTLTLSLLAIQAAAMRDAGESAGMISRFIISYSLSAAIALVAIFAVLGALSFFLVLRTSSRVVGPIERLERQLQEMIEGASVAATNLREGDYLANLVVLINRLTQPKQSSQSSREPQRDSTNQDSGDRDGSSDDKQNTA